ncbi:aldose 1-epimerase family protein [Glaciibacter psychrotolerans]|uniref:Aldose 1-epimerase n=1 Tax=Glaciibacter psychrotolerans TaxID=670054 RepID=A0A7Z0EHC3_9MICO|nr:aldose 1-epimerase family protein [Leifsonia psychrotolerans]NYJ21686.1 aldose 1-epimerase [Leifsonia psychrotolerans]
MRAPTGTQHHLRRETTTGLATATITEIAAGLRSYAVNGIDLVETFAEHSTPPMAAGIVLAPWPNRIRDGAWTQNGVTRQLALTEPARRNASHGLLRFVPYSVVNQTADSITLAATIFPQTGYPFHLETTVSYALTETGIEVTHGVQNVGQDAAPYAVGAHPYLQIGGVPSSELTLTVNAATRILVDERQNPVGQEAVTGTDFDLRAGRRVGELDLDTGYADVSIVDGQSEHALTASDGRSVCLWGDANVRYVQVFTPTGFPAPGHALPGFEAGTIHQAVAIEPMTAPANAFNTGEGLHWVAPGERWAVRWGIRHRGFPVQAERP